MFSKVCYGSKVFHTFEHLVVKFSMGVVKVSMLVKFSIRLRIW
jgi:hypothetical protein